MTAIRYDNLQLDAAQAVKLDGSGFLRVPVFATRAGIFNYRRADGTIRRELRHPDEVFKSDSLQTLAGVPFTNRHPTEAVTSANVRKYMVGSVSDNISRKDEFVETSVTIMDEKTIEDVEQRGLRQVSCGYRCDVEITPGEYEGQRYDAVQKNIRYNHLAGVPKGRAGPEVRLRMDHDDAELVGDDVTPSKKPPKKKGKGMRITLDGVEYDTEDASFGPAFAKYQQKKDAELAKVIDAAKSDTEDAKKERDKMEARLDQLEEDNKKLKADAEAAPKTSDLVKARVALVSAASPHLDADTVEKIDDMTDRDVQVAVIAAHSEKFDGEGKSDDYIQARYDSIIEADIKPAGSRTPSRNQRADNDVKTTKLDQALAGVARKRKDGEIMSAEEVRQENMRKDENLWQLPLGSTAPQAQEA